MKGVSDLAVNLQRVEAGTALHLIRYDYDDEADRVPPLDLLVPDLRLPLETEGVGAVSPQADLVASAERATDGRLRLVLRSVPLYGVVLIRRAER